MKTTETLSQNQYLLHLSVEGDQVGMRLDRFLKKYYTRRSRVRLRIAIESGAIKIRRDQSPHLALGKIKPSLKLLAGDEILVLSERKREPDVNFDYKTVYEDDALLVINKSAPLPVHPAGKYFFNTLIMHLRTQNLPPPQDPGEVIEIPSEREFYLAHRIDKETSGLLVLAKSREACAHLVKQFAQRSTKKYYLAIVRGIPPGEFSVKEPLMRDPHSRVKLKMCTGSGIAGALTAHTDFERVETHGRFSLIRCRLHTGRQHQIRVHLEYAGFPLVGDKLYGLPPDQAWRFFEGNAISAEAQAFLILPRHALHSAYLEFEHPISGERMKFESELPEELMEFFRTGLDKPKTALPQEHRPF